MAKILRNRLFISIAGLFLLASVGSIASVALSKHRRESIISYNYETVAQNVPVFYPSVVEEVQTLIRDANQKGVKVRFAGASHSTSSVILGSGIYIKSKNFNHIDGIEMDPVYGPVVTVESGVKSGDLANYLGERGFSLGFAYPYYYDLTIGGLLSTGAHGSSRKHTALSSQNIIELTLVNGRGELVTVNDQTPDLLKAARVSLGLLGFIYKIKLKVIPDFNIEFRSKTLVGENAILQKDGSVNFGPVADTEYIYWFPKYNRAVKVEGSITDQKAFPGAQSVVLGEPVAWKDQIDYQAMAIGKNNRTVNKWLEDYRFKNLAKDPPPYVYLKNGKEVRAQGIIGKSAKMLISKRLPLNSVYTAQDISFSFRVEDAPKVLSIIHSFCKENDFYHPIAGIFFRFARANGQNYLSVIERQDGSPEDLYVMAEFFEPKKYTQNDPPSESSRLRKKLLELLTFQNLVTFHWGKNRDEIFANQANKKLMETNIQEFEKARQIMDPEDVFSNSFVKEFVF